VSTTQPPTNTRPEPAGQVPIYYSAHVIFWYGIYLVIRGPNQFSLKWLLTHIIGLVVAAMSGLVIDRYMPASHRERFASDVPRDYHPPDSS
jgi:hypothetical protein